jgi:hypothetical protein
MKNFLSPVGRAAPALACLLALAACSDQAKVQPSADAALLARLDEVEQRLREMEEASELAVHAGSGQGLQAQSTSDRLLRMEKALDDLRRASAVAKTGDAPPAGQPESETGTGDGTAARLEPIPADQPLPEDQIAWYRRLEEEVRRRRAEEQQIERFKRDIARSKAVLTPEQEAAVIQLETAYTKKVRELYATRTGDASVDRTAMNEKRAVLFSEFETQVRAAVPASEADKLLSTLQERNRAFYGGTPRVRPGGMGGGDGSGN